MQNDIGIRPFKNKLWLSSPTMLLVFFHDPVGVTRLNCSADDMENEKGRIAARFPQCGHQNVCVYDGNHMCCLSRRSLRAAEISDSISSSFI